MLHRYTPLRNSTVPHPSEFPLPFAVCYTSLLCSHKTTFLYICPPSLTPFFTHFLLCYPSNFYYTCLYATLFNVATANLPSTIFCYTKLHSLSTLCYMLHPTTPVFPSIGNHQPLYFDLLLCDLLQCTILPSRNTTLSLFCLVPDFFLVLLCIYVFCALIPRLLYLLQLKKKKKKTNKQTKKTKKKQRKKKGSFHSLSFTLLLLYLFTSYIQVLKYPFPRNFV